LVFNTELLTPEEKSKLYIGSSLVRNYINNNYNKILGSKGKTKITYYGYLLDVFLIIVAEVV